MTDKTLARLVEDLRFHADPNSYPFDSVTDDLSSGPHHVLPGLVRFAEVPRSTKALLARAADAIASLQSPALGGGWQDIETAPKDGTFVLLHDRSDYPSTFVGRWDAYYDAFRPPGAYRITPSHWMPLPPPQTNQGNRPDNGTEAR